MSDQPKLRTAEDALRDPRPGDVVRTGRMFNRTYYEVTATDKHGVPVWFECDGLETPCSLVGWRELFLTECAEVLHVAQEVGSHD